MIIIVDYGMGNLRSVQNKFEKIGKKVEISSDPKIISSAAKLILPGVGHFASAVRRLKNTPLWNILNQKALNEKVPILGICLGMQLMAKNSEEGESEGLGWFDAEIVRFNVINQLKFKIPHIGWNTITNCKNSMLLQNIPEDALFYFVHSFYIKCNYNKDILASTKYEHVFTSAIQRDNIYGVQFHPEKSHDWGEIVFQNFLNI